MLRIIGLQPPSLSLKNIINFLLGLLLIHVVDALKYFIRYLNSSLNGLLFKNNPDQICESLCIILLIFLYLCRLDITFLVFIKCMIING